MNRTVVLNVLALIGVGMIMKHCSPHGSLDSQIYYSGEEARVYLKGLTDGQSFSYFVNQFWDLLFIFLYSALGYFSVKKLFSTIKMAPWLALIPGVFDLIETTSILFILKLGDAINALDALGVVTLLKWCSGGLLAVLIILKFLMVKGVIPNWDTKPSEK